MTSDTISNSVSHTQCRCLDVKAAAAYLGICPRTLDNWRSQGRGPTYIRVGGRRIVYRIEDLERYLEDGIVGAGTR
jgi:predicted DNA-binding transcriptional regulator AlpA